jgi:hypothetical protein
VTRDTPNLYEFVYRGLLTEQALDTGGRQGRHASGDASELRSALNFDLLDARDLDVSLQMATVYAAITAFERAARRFVAKVLQSEHGEAWWDECVSDAVRRFAESRRADEDRVKWHGTRGDDPLTYTEMGQLLKIIQQNWQDFEPHVRTLDWAASIFNTVERSRNVIMHSGVLARDDVERVGMNIRDWVLQVGA